MATNAAPSPPHPLQGEERSESRSGPGGAAWFLLVALTLIGTFWSWSRVEGAPMADVVEYLERAQALVRGEEVIDSQPIRAIGVSLLHAPLLWLADGVGVEHGDWVLWLAAALHIALTIALILGAAFFASSLARVAGGSEAVARRAALFAGFSALACPTLLQYAPHAMSDIPAGAAFAFAVPFALFGPASVRRAAASGALLGASALFAFKAIPLIGLAWLATFVVRGMRDGLRGAARFACLQLAMLAVFAALQGIADLVTYGRFAEGLRVYLLVNFGQVIARLLLELGLVEWYEWSYRVCVNALDSYPTDLADDAATLDGLGYSTHYFDHFEWVFSRVLLPFLALGVAGALWGARRRGERALERLGALCSVAAPLVIAAAFAVATAAKGSAEIRLWLPILPILCAYTGVGLGLLAGASFGNGLSVRGVLAVGVVGFALLQGVRSLRLDTPDRFGAFARAANWLEELGPRLPARADDRLHVASSYHWAVLFRTPPEWELTKLPHQISGLEHVDDDGVRATFDAILEQDALIVHSALLTHPLDPAKPWVLPLFDLLSRNFHVAAAFWDRSVDPGVGMILVLTREVPEGDQLRVISRTAASPSRDSTPDAGDPPHRTIRLERTLQGQRESVDLAGVRATELPGDGVLWVEFDLDRRSETIVSDHYAIHLRVRGPEGARGFDLLRRPRWNKASLRDVPQGFRLTEGMPVAVHQGPLAKTLPASPLERGDEVSLWFDLGTSIRDERMVPMVNGRLDAMDPVALDHPERDDVPAGGGPSDDGFTFSDENGALLIGTVSRIDDQTTLRLEGSLARQ